jgi:PKD repeat protein
MLSAQVDTEFWFVVPEISHRGSTGGKPGTLRLSTLELEATVTIEMPANPAFTPIVLNIPANGDAAVDLSHLIDDVASPAITGLENKPLTPDGINPFGLHILSTNMINAYWEVNYIYGADIWTLKGSNGLGTLFYTPFQTEYPNNLTMMPSYSAIDVVATQDGTMLTFNLPDGIGASFGEPMTNIMATTPGATFTIGPLLQGETFSLFPYMMSASETDRLAGTRISSTSPIAVTLKDDNLNTASPGRSTIGEQIVPVDIIGDTYVVPSMGNPNLTFVVATQDNTSIYIDDVLFATLNEGEQVEIQSPNNQIIVISTKNHISAAPGPPVYVLHLALNNMTRAAALLPPIGCTGNTQLSFIRAREEIREKFYFFLITETENIAKFMIDGAPADLTIIPDDITKWEQLGNGWSAYMTGNIPASKLAIGQHLVENTGGIFHLAIINGFTSANLGDMFYGYFSDYGGLNVGAVVAGTNSSVIRACYGTPVQLHAYGGTNYEWTPQSYLDDPYSNLPFAINLPAGAHEYVAHVSGACGSGDVPLTVVVAPPVTAHFETNVTSGCSPLTVVFDDQSEGNATWQYDLGDGTPLILYDTLASTTTVGPPPDPFVFSNTYVNNTDSAITFEVTLMVKNSSACADIITKTITVFPEIHSDFTVAPDIACDPLESHFTNLSSGDTATWLWEFGDGGSSTEREPVHEYRNLFGPGNLVFDASLIAISPYNCRDTSTRSVTVRPYIEAMFAFDTVFECTPHEIWITDQSYGADTYLWDFGDGDTSTSSGPTIIHTYVNNTPFPVNRTINLRVENDEGCWDTISREVTIFPEINAAFTATPAEGCSPFEVIFRNNSSGASSYLWDFGDGGTSTDLHPIHLYEPSLLDYDTVYTVTLTATSDELCTDTDTFDVVIHPYIEAAFTVEDIVGCHPFTITIDNQSIGADQYFWDFGDGSPVSDTSAATFQHTYLNPSNATATYQLQLIVRNVEGCEDTLVRYVTVHPEMTASFTADVFDGCHPLTVSFTDLSVNADIYLWEFGDGASSVEASPVHTFTNFGITDTTYTVTLTTSTADGECVKWTSWPVVVRPQVEAEFTFSEAFGCHPFEVTFENLSRGGVTYTWDFGDGTVITTMDAGPVTHTFLNADFTDIVEYEVILRVENPSSCTSEQRKTVSVYPDIQAGFLASVKEGCHPLHVDFNNLSFGAQDYLWDFGDGSSSSLRDPSRTFTNTGTVDSVYTVTLVSTASNNYCRDTLAIDIIVHPYVMADFTIPDPLGCNPFDVVIENASVNAELFRWDFGDGIDTVTTTLDPFVHRFTNANFVNQREFEITLVAENFAGCTSEIRRTITVEPDIRAGFLANTTEGCHPLDVNFMNLSWGASYYIWDFGDGTTSQAAQPSRTFTNTGTADSTYRVWLYATASNNVCQDSFFIDITVHPYIHADFTFVEGINCNPTSVIFNNASVGGDMYYWDFGDGSDTITTSADPVTHRFINIDYTNQQEYEIILIAENLAGCTSEIRRTITIEPDITALFDASQLSGCHPLEVDFTNLSDGAAYYLWDFGDGTTSQLVNPEQTFTNIGSADTTYRVWLHGWAQNNICRDSFYLDIVVHPYVNADFAFLEGIHCSPSAVQFNNASFGGNTYSWDFGDGSDTLTADMGPVTHTFSNPSYTDIRVFQVRLRAENNGGCISEINRTVSVYPDIEAAFSVSMGEGCHPLEVDFTNLSNGGYTYFWNFGDGSTSESDAPGHTFTNFTDAPVTRQVSLSALSRFNCPGNATAQITIHPKPKARFETDRIIDCPPLDLPIINTSLNADQYTWIFGDGDSLQTSSMDPLNHVYNNATGDIAAYEMTLGVVSNFGCTDTTRQTIYVYPATVADFSFNNEGCSPLSVAFDNETVRGYDYFWDFGDGTTMTIQDPTNIYFNFSDHDTMYYINLTSTSQHGCMDSKTDSVYVYAQPEAEFIALPSHQEFPSSTVTVDNMTNPGNWNYQWDMGDGSTSSLENPQPHTYATWGDFLINLHVSSFHCADSVWHTIRIFPTKPIADFDTVYPGCEPHTVQFRNNSLYGDAYLWEFDDGSTSNEFEPTHTFTEAGIYNVKLTVTGDGGIDYAYHQVEVYTLPMVNFRVAPIEVMLPDQEIKLFNLSEFGTTYLWDFGDGSTSSEESPRYLYSATGTYDISLDVWTEHGCTDRLVIPEAVTVRASGLIMFPNAFKPVMTGPNGGYYTLGEPERNHIFHPYWEGVEEYHLLIYSRWGELVFSSDDVNIGWDGYLDGQLASQDVYAWRCWGIFTNGQPFELVGDVTLLHHDKTK